MKVEKCPECLGTGIFEKAPDSSFSLDCPVCDGEGTIDIPEKFDEREEMSQFAERSRRLREDLVFPPGSDDQEIG